MIPDLNQLLTFMVEHKGTTLHLVSGSPPLIKISSGALAALTEDPLSSEDIETMFERTLTNEQKKILVETKELNTAYGITGLSRFRASILYQRGALCGIFRLTPQNPPGLDELGFPPILKEIASKPQGLILIAGPKGSGTSQTMAALLDYLLSTRNVQIISLENPIEYVFKNKKGIIYQREIGTDALSFKQALRTALRQDPDVLALSELPDPEVVLGALSAGSAGQLVIATLPANGVIMAIEQLVEQAPQFQQYLRTQLASCLEIAISQLLLKKQDGNGLALALEILIGNPAVKNTIREGKVQQLLPLMNNGRDVGMISQELALKNLTKKNLISTEEAMAKAIRPEELKRFLALQV